MDAQTFGPLIVTAIKKGIESAFDIVNDKLKSIRGEIDLDREANKNTFVATKDAIKAVHETTEALAATHTALEATVEGNAKRMQDYVDNACEDLNGA